ncbi:isocitrate lyase/PEP mutase family protein [Dactylosporangium sp. AC04546]|uniref:isocitrate lyase/PEP mutase family protein n=1 Tax=Dactylosporangium sp. AC04546 TaxID=2862460 RepID=UPI001EE01157|nr:isocitrate lyase/PEP mutase family protein [Dactylosporangium sp. AC04546]WVK81467.1 isocitrate lyase/PEP mutase family protein [Dactylosporangium sp. AC04546]
MRSLLAGPGVTHLAGVYDPVTAALARAAGFRAAHLSGAAVAALALGLPDLGYVHGTHIADRAATIAPALDGVPLLADADTGYGTAIHAVWTARRYAAAGVAGLHIEDQVSPKRCGHLAGKEVVDAATAAGKIQAVAEAGTGLVLVARTDAYSVTGLSDAIERSARYVAAGADAVFVEGVSDRDGLAAVHDALPGVPLVVNRSEAGGPTGDGLPDEELSDLGVRLVLHPVAPLLAALEAARAAYAAIAHAGHAGAVPRLSWQAFTALVGQPDALALDSRYGGPS